MRNFDRFIRKVNTHIWGHEAKRIEKRIVPKGRMKTVFKFFIIQLFFLICVASASAVDIRIDAGRLSLNAERVPLLEILRRMADLGVKVKVDPDLNPLISASFENQDMQRGLDSVFKGLNYALFWETPQGYSVSDSALVEIQIFKPGQKEHMQPLRARSVLQIGRNPKNGSLFVKNEIILKLKPGISPLQFQKLLKQVNGQVVSRNGALRIYQLRLPKNSDVTALINRIKNHPWIAKAEPNYAYPVLRPYRYIPPEEPPPADDRPDRTNSNGVPVAILDTGLNPEYLEHEYVLAALNSFDPDAPISDDLGHGTQMALIASGEVEPYGADIDSEAINPVIAIKAFDDNGYTSNALIMQSIDFALKNGARVISLSWGSDTESDFLEDTLDFARSKGLFIVASAGNEPTGKPVFPAAYDAVIGVGALSPDRKPWKKSNHGDFVTLSAPGFANLPVGHKDEPGIYAGTSISAAYMARVIANYLDQNPNGTVQDFINIIKKEDSSE